MENPCIDCITYPICRIEFIDKLLRILETSQHHPRVTKMHIYEEIHVAYHLTLKKKCSLISNYIFIQSTAQIRNASQEEYNYNMTNSVVQTISDAFNIEDIMDR